MPFDFMNTVKNNLQQQFAGDQTQNPSPMDQFGPQTPPPPSLPASQPSPASSPQSVGAMLPPDQTPSIPQPTPDQGMGSPLDNPAGISLQELLQLGINAYMSQLLQSTPQGGQNGQAQPQG